MDVFVSSMKNESYSFCGGRTDIDAFRRREYVCGPAIPKRSRCTRTESGSSFDAADEFGWEMIHSQAAAEVPAGLVTRKAFENLSGVILTELKDALSVDGIPLILQGTNIAAHAGMQSMTASSFSLRDPDRERIRVGKAMNHFVPVWPMSPTDFRQTWFPVSFQHNRSLYVSHCGFSQAKCSSRLRAQRRKAAIYRSQS
ncbi:M81 family metallopeptidase [Sinorhizobium meliloti]|uniref:M81 family metallopeptidase n=1 Tax=Rhizobium meliloti TaxID=382 RepID=UPI000B49E7A2|nr:M81 family metallopeptidase [Sinorhizobium meliloti]ASP69736.1 hypothetical protein CDO29_36080 [Sinorhizobium meliloti]MQX01274.1 hypothetical protein [Sinorhizobium meliloti]RVK37858.1 hypothetical protein CN160_35645 [Sinorhizobium meliloti]